MAEQSLRERLHSTHNQAGNPSSGRVMRFAGVIAAIAAVVALAAFALS